MKESLGSDGQSGEHESERVSRSPKLSRVAASLAIGVVVIGGGYYASKTIYNRSHGDPCHSTFDVGNGTTKDLQLHTKNGTDFTVLVKPAGDGNRGQDGKFHFSAYNLQVFGIESGQHPTRDDSVGANEREVVPIDNKYNYVLAASGEAGQVVGSCQEVTPKANSN